MAVNAGRDFHRTAAGISRPVPGPPAFFIGEELQERFALAKETQRIIRNEADKQSGDIEKYRVFQLNLVQSSAFLCVDLDNLHTRMQFIFPRGPPALELPGNDGVSTLTL